MKWKDGFGSNLQEGDIIEDTRRRIIGRVNWHNGLPAMEAIKRFSARTMGYELMDNKGPKEAYIVGIVPRHTKVWYWRHGYVLDHVEILQHAQPRRRSNMIPLWE